MRFTFLIVVFFAGIRLASGQRPLAQYPLETEGKSILRLYDVSGHAYHGVLVNNSKKAPADIFTADVFPGGVSCIRKVTHDAATIAVPPFYRNSDLAVKGFAITFWVYFDSKDTRVNNIIIYQSRIFSVGLWRDVPNVANSFLYYHTEIGSIEPIKNNYDFDKTGWYFVAVSYTSVPLNAPQVSFASYYYDGQTYNPDQRSLLHTELPNQIPIFYKKEESQVPGALLDRNFQTRIWNVQFYDHNLTLVQINSIRNDSWNLAQGNMGYAYADRYYLLASTLGYYPCTRNGSDNVIRDMNGGRNSTAVTDLSFTTDRFDIPDHAIRFGPKGNVSLPPFYQAFGNSPAYDVRKGYTISFWTYIDQALFPPDDQSTPYTPKDMAYQYFYLCSPGGALGGIESIRDRVVLDRYIDLNPLRYWRLWLWDPVSLQNAKGWYQVIFSQKENAVRVVIYKPDGTRGCRLNYFNSQDFAQQPAAKFGFGFPPVGKGNYQACGYLDDFRIYNWPFSEGEADRLHSYEMRRAQ